MALVQAIAVPDIYVGGFDMQPPVILTEGSATSLALAEVAARKCRVPVTWA